MDAVRIVTEPRRREILRLVWDAERQPVIPIRSASFGAVSQPRCATAGRSCAR
jgi:hypothetical protein